MKAKIALVGTLLIFFSVALGFAEEKWTPSKDLQRLVSWMSGSFSSQEQAAIDSTYHDVRVLMVRVWKHRTDGYWLYVEQALADYPDLPYRQRVYHITQLNDDFFESAVYALDASMEIAVLSGRDSVFATLLPDALVKKDGCSMILRKIAEIKFVGSTIGTDCPSELEDAAYATSEVMIKEKEMVAWDRGYDKDGKQVWGPKKGGYIFKKIKAFPID